jgi:hypothetical protein
VGGDRAMDFEGVIGGHVDVEVKESVEAAAVLGRGVGKPGVCLLG